MISTRIVVLLGLMSCCWSVGANVIATSPAPVADTVAAPPNVSDEPSSAPAVSHTVHATIAPGVPKEPTGDNAAAPLSTHAPVVVSAHSPAPIKEHTEPQAKHHHQATPSTTIVPAHVVVGSERPIVSVHHHTTVVPAVEVCTGFCDYIKPICESLGKISPKQLFKIQTQFKQFVQKTNGKMSLCFVEHYSLDPTFKAVSHEDLSAICASRKQQDGAKGSFQAFQTCATNHWDPVLDKDLAVIKEARANSTSHQHPKSETVASNIEHEEEELSMISAVVNKVLGQGGNLNEKNSDLKVIDVSGKTTVAPVVVPIVDSSTHSPIVHHKSSTVSPTTYKGLLNDPNNTVMVFVDDIKTTLAPIHVAHHANSTVHIIATTTVKPAVTISTSSPIAIEKTTTTTTNSTAAMPAVTTKAPVINGTHSINSTTASPATSTKAPAINVTTTGKPMKLANETTTTTVAPTTLAPTEKAVSTTIAPAIGTSTKSPDTTPASSASPSTSTPTKAAATTPTAKVATSSSTTKPTLKPIETLEQILHRQEKEKENLDNKLKAERTKAINQLKKQQDGPSWHAATADAKIHQREHERQMSIDPIGHTIKHQNYEAKKQQKSSAE